MNDSKTYTAKDIERYHSGQMSVAEMHALEKAALDDPFLANALEGYTYTQTPQADLDSLQQRLRQRIEKKEEKRGIFYIGNSWMRIAALFILFAGGGWLVYQTLSPEKEGLATTQKVPNQIPSPAPENTTDSAPVSTDAPVNEGLVSTQPTILQPQQKTEALDKSVMRREAANPAPPMMLRRPADDSTISRGIIASETMSIRINPNEDSVARNKDLAMKKENPSAPLPDTIKNLDVVLKRTEVDPKDVVVLNKNVSQARTRKMQATIDSLEPASGWSDFDDYIVNNLRAPEELRSKPTRGEVELSFDVNQNGEPVNITVVRSLCTKCDEEAIRLLKEGPKWKKNKKKGRIKIKF